MSSEQQLAVARSNQDAKASNDFVRVTGQLSILINGGAAAAILGYLSHFAEIARLKTFAALALGGYAFGVLAGTCAIFFMIFCAERWAEYWRNIASDGRPKPHEDAANAWSRLAYWLFGLSLTFFSVSTFVMAIGLFCE